ncbi:hypothetical protein P5673_029640 [Acropora cervicornis]|uniref:Uncharacterized protein n=1 Tax=Acropora cervicornis TaxID=6130 RepID=A0AAD9PVG8_ACRCE|nr:hypothetical protein P5673_029640 [Acropora cervicornis]
MELKKIKKNLEAAKHSKLEKPNDSEPEFKFGKNMKQYKLNRNMLDKIGSAMATSDDKVRKNLFQEELDHSVYVENVELACATPVKGRLREHLAFWKDIGASKWVLDVLRDGYSVPFMSLLQKASFNNHGSLAEEHKINLYAMK